MIKYSLRSLLIFIAFSALVVKAFTLIYPHIFAGADGRIYVNPNGPQIIIGQRDIDESISIKIVEQQVISTRRYGGSLSTRTIPEIVTRVAFQESQGRTVLSSGSYWSTDMPSPDYYEKPKNIILSIAGKKESVAVAYCIKRRILFTEWSRRSRSLVGSKDETLELFNVSRQVSWQSTPIPVSPVKIDLVNKNSLWTILAEYDNGDVYEYVRISPNCWDQKIKTQVGHPPVSSRYDPSIKFQLGE